MDIRNVVVSSYLCYDDVGRLNCAAFDNIC